MNLAERLGEEIITENLNLVLKTGGFVDPSWEPMENEPEYDICLRENNGCIGYLSTYDKTDDMQIWQYREGKNKMVGYLMDKDERRKGYATEALAGLTARLMLEGIVPFLEIDSKNVASVKTAQKAGYEQIGEQEYKNSTQLYYAPSVLEL